MQVAEHSRRGVGRGDRVHSLVDPAVGVEPVLSAGALDELPHAHGADARAHGGVEAALGHRHTPEVGGQLLTLQRVADHGSVAGAPPDPGLHHRASARVLSEVLEVAHHLRVPADGQVGELEPLEPGCRAPRIV